MSIMPLPDLSPDLRAEPEGIHLSALDSYLGQPGSLPGVGFWPRGAARIVDWVIHYFVGYGAGFLFRIMLEIVAGMRHTSVRALLRHQTSGHFAVYAFALLGSVVFEAICEGLHGSTPGKRVLSMVVLQEDGSPCRMGSAWIRSFAYFIDALFFGRIGYFNMQKNPQRQRHGDEWAHTVVCRRSNVAAANLRSGGQFTGALFLAVLADAMLLIFGLLISLTS